MLALMMRILTLLAFATLAHAAEPDAPRYALEPVAGKVHRFTAGHYHSAILATREGILVTDPVDPEAAEWLKAELARRFDAPIRYLVYSHNHFDHTLGGRVFDDPSITCVAHEFVREDLVATRTDTRLPDLSFRDGVTLHLGDHRVRLRHHGPNNGRGSVSMKFEPDDVMFVVDWIVLGRMPYKDLKGYDIQGMIHSTREVLDEDFATFVGGHGKAGTKEDVARYLRYLETLQARVVEGRRAGRTVEQLQREIRLDEFRDLDRYEEWLPLNIAGVARILDDQSYLDMQLEE